jgi:cysteinyl-tRNA synthetase
VLEVFDAVFDVLKAGETATAATRNGALSDAQIEALIADRNQARKSRDFTRADAIRRELLESGIVLEDAKEGVRWKRKG